MCFFVILSQAGTLKRTNPFTALLVYGMKASAGIVTLATGTAKVMSTYM
jgi:hypothetical protein